MEPSPVRMATFEFKINKLVAWGGRMAVDGRVTAEFTYQGSQQRSRPGGTPLECDVLRMDVCSGEIIAVLPSRMLKKP
jgi:hypothetical protein